MNITAAQIQKKITSTAETSELLSQLIFSLAKYLCKRRDVSETIDFLAQGREQPNSAIIVVNLVYF